MINQGNKKIFFSEDEWRNNLEILGIINGIHIRIATEGALIGGILKNGFNPDLAIMSDDAGQFNILLHAGLRTCKRQGYYGNKKG